jgi:hypothetical protein
VIGERGATDYFSTHFAFAAEETLAATVFTWFVGR